MKQKTILIFAYYSYLDPVFQSAVLPYFQDFPDNHTFRFVLLTFEQKQFAIEPTNKRALKSELLNKHNIIWIDTVWHSGRFKHLKKGYDFLYGFLLSAYLIVRYQVQIVYSEGFPGAIITHFLTRLLGKKHIVHTFEPHADYMIESGIWTKNSWESRIVKCMQLKIAQKAHAILTATYGMIDMYKQTCPNTIFERVPSCVDLSLFKFDDQMRDQKRSELGFERKDKVLVYLGKFGGMYWDEEVFDLFECFQKSTVHSYKLLIISNENATNYTHRLSQDVKWLQAKRADVTNYLAASDIAICGVKPIDSRRFSSPIKNGEYWANGLKIIVPKGISDDYIFSENEGIGFVLNSLDTKGYNDILSQIENDFTSFQRCQNAVSFVQKDRSVAVYQQLYLQLFS